MEITRSEHIRAVRDALNRSPVVAVLGPRQVGKTTLARQVIASAGERATVFDLEDDRDLAKLVDPYLALEPLDGLVVIDEIQRRPDLFRSLRVLADRPGRPARFLILGSASPSLLRQGSESLAGRIAFHELGGLDPEEVIPPITAYYVMRVGRLRLVPYYPPGDESLAGAVREIAAKHHSMLLANHGPVVAGKALDAAVYAIEELEETAKLFLLLHGRTTRILTPAQVAELTARFPS